MTTITKTIVRATPGGGCLEITAELREDHARFSDGFAVGAQLWEKRGRTSGYTRRKQKREPDAVGCLHDEILRAAPELAPLVDLHLANPHGMPMHALENGWYFYSGEAAAYERRQIAAGHDYGYSRNLLVHDHDRAARALAIAPESLPFNLDRAGFEDFVRSLTDVYQRRADAGRALLLSLGAPDTASPAA